MKEGFRAVVTIINNCVASIVRLAQRGQGFP